MDWFRPHYRVRMKAVEWDVEVNDGNRHLLQEAILSRGWFPQDVEGRSGRLGNVLLEMDHRHPGYHTYQTIKHSFEIRLRKKAAAS